jgi:hypothetical protein
VNAVADEIALIAATAADQYASACRRGDNELAESATPLRLTPRPARRN